MPTVGEVSVSVSDLSQNSVRFVTIVAGEIDSGQYPDDALACEGKTLNLLSRDLDLLEE